MKKVLCSTCLEEDPNYDSRDEGVGGTYYGDSYSFDSDIRVETSCCGSETVLVVDMEYDIELPVIKRFIKIFGVKGTITEFVKEVSAIENEKSLL